MKALQIRRLALCAVMTAVILLLTTFVHIPLPIAVGYVHVGDMAICLAAALLPAPYAIAAAALGGALSDLLGGYGYYAIFTAVIKAAMPFNAVQGAASFVLFLGAALALDRLNFKSRLDRRMTR